MTSLSPTHRSSPFSSKLRGLALQSLLTFSREYPNKCNWEKNMAATMRALLGLLDDEEPPTRTMALRVVREILKTSNKMTGEFSEPLTLKVVKSFADNDTSVSTPFVTMGTDHSPLPPSHR